MSDDLNRRQFLTRAGAVLGTSGLALLSKPQIVAASDAEVTRFSRKAEDIPPDQHALMVSGRPAAVASVPFELLQSSIDFNGLTAAWAPGREYVDPDYGRTVAAMEGSDRVAEVVIHGAVPAGQIAQFLQAIEANKGSNGVPSRRTMVVLLKEWMA